MGEKFNDLRDLGSVKEDLLKKEREEDLSFIVQNNLEEEKGWSSIKEVDRENGDIYNVTFYGNLDSRRVKAVMTNKDGIDHLTIEEVKQ
jgi:hypothetical protein